MYVKCFRNASLSERVVEPARWWNPFRVLCKMGRMARLVHLSKGLTHLEKLSKGKRTEDY